MLSCSWFNFTVGSAHWQRTAKQETGPQICQQNNRYSSKTVNLLLRIHCWHIGSTTVRKYVRNAIRLNNSEQKQRQVTPSHIHTEQRMWNKFKMAVSIRHSTLTRDVTSTTWPLATHQSRSRAKCAWFTKSNDEIWIILFPRSHAVTPKFLQKLYNVSLHCELDP